MSIFHFLNLSYGVKITFLEKKSVPEVFHPANGKKGMLYNHLSANYIMIILLISNKLAHTWKLFFGTLLELKWPKFASSLFSGPVWNWSRDLDIFTPKVSKLQSNFSKNGFICQNPSKASSRSRIFLFSLVNVCMYLFIYF